MPAHVTFENYLTKPEEHISLPKLDNLRKILTAINYQCNLHPENPYLTFQQIREATNLQANQVHFAMDQRGMKVLFEGRGIAFGLSNTGRQVIAGERQLSLAGISRKATAQQANTYLQPLTREEFAELTDKEKASVRNANAYLKKLLTDKLSPSLENADPTNVEYNTMLIRAMIFEAQRTLTKLVPRHPNAHELAQQINTAKPTITPSHPNGVKTSLDQANVSA